MNFTVQAKQNFNRVDPGKAARVHDLCLAAGWLAGAPPELLQKMAAAGGGQLQRRGSGAGWQG